MPSGIEARFEQVRHELRHVRRAAQSIVFGMHHLACLEVSQRGPVPKIVATDRRSMAVGLRLGMSLGLLPRSEVRVMRSAKEIVAFIQGLEVDEEAGSFPVVVSRLLYVRHFALFQPMRESGQLIVM